MARARADRQGEGVTTTLAATLTVLAVVDSTSFGTLLIPIWLLLAPGRTPVRRVLVFLGTVGAFYFALGLGLLAGAAVVVDQAGDLLDGPVAARVQLVVGVALLVWSFRLGRPDEATGGDGRLSRWRRLVGADEGGALPLVGLALTAALLESATMLPYLAATAMISSADLSSLERTAVLAGYCLVMLLPALVLLALRVLLHRSTERVLVRVGGWLERTSAEATAWVVGIVGFLIARDAVTRVPEVLDLMAR